MKHLFITTLLALMGASSVLGNNIKVVMNSTSPFMSLKDKATGEPVDVGTPEARTYNFEAAPGTYVLTGYASDETTVSETIELNVTDDSQEFKTTITSLKMPHLPIISC